MYRWAGGAKIGDTSVSLFEQEIQFRFTASEHFSVRFHKIERTMSEKSAGKKTEESRRICHVDSGSQTKPAHVNPVEKRRESDRMNDQRITVDSDISDRRSGANRVSVLSKRIED
jgi:hypothetical protein